ncbi:transporter substrate-binding domain-containing protein [Thermodesulfobacteriota bacterium]
MMNIARTFPVLLFWTLLASVSFFEVGVVCAQESEHAVSLTSEEQTWLKAHPDIRLGYTDTLEPEVIDNRDGTYSGMVVDFLDALNEKLGSEIGLRVYSIPELLDKAKNKRIDGILNLHPEYADNLGLLKTQSYWPAYPAVFARKETSFKSSDDFAGKRVAIIEGVYITQKFMGQHGKQATILKVDDALGGLQSVEKGEADLFLGFSYNSFFIPKYQLFDVVPAYVFVNSPEWFCIGIREDWPELVSILNKGISGFSEEEIHAIIAKWSYLPAKQDTIKLTPKERAWLDQGHTVRVFSTDHAPLMFYKEGKPFGISADLLKEISERTGIKFDIAKPLRDFPSALKSLIEHEGPDVFAGLAPTPEREKVILFTKPYVSSPKFIFTRDDTGFISSMANLSGKTVAVIGGYVTHKLLAENYPDINLLSYKKNEEALRAVSSGKAFAFIGSLLATSSMINEFGLINLKASAPSALPEATVAMGIRSDWPELRDIIDKAFDAIPESEKAAIINKWSSVKFEHGIRPEKVLKWILMATGGAAGILILFLFWNRSLAGKVRQRTNELESSNKSLEVEVAERKEKEQQLQEYQKRLKALAFQLTFAEEKERRAIAADLHDHVGHWLALARMQLNNIAETKSAIERNLLLDDISNILLSAIKETRGMISELSSPSMNEIGLGAAISEWLEEHIGKRYPLQTEFIDNIDDRRRKSLDENVRAVLFRNVRELITNVVKHAGATKVVVRLTEEADMIKILVEDDGVGFDPGVESKNKAGGFGLFSIQERMTDLGGTFEIESEPNKGCRVTLTLPVQGKESVQR